MAWYKSAVVSRAVRQIGTLPRRTRLVPLLQEYVQTD